MCHERLAFGGTHPPDFQEFVLQNTSFPFGVRASGHRFPCPGGTSFRDTAPGELRETVLRNASFAGETSVLGHDDRRTGQGQLQLHLLDQTPTSGKFYSHKNLDWESVMLNLLRQGV